MICGRIPGTTAGRTHDMNTANWVPDLFMKRVEEEGSLDPVFSE